MDSAMILAFLDDIKSRTSTKVFIIIVILMSGWLIARVSSRWLARVVEDRLDLHRGMLVRRFTYYLIMAIALVTALNEAGINLSVVIGAAGVASVAIGFASQTSMSNLISGVFVIIEKPFMVGDTIKIGSTIGEVATMGLLSTMLKTPDNTLVRIPNESLMKSEITNITRFSTRRFEFVLTLPHGIELKKAKDMSLACMDKIPTVLKDPKPSVVHKAFLENSIQFTVYGWARSDKLGEASFEASSEVYKLFGSHLASKSLKKVDSVEASPTF
jgi:small-conductance mechanosensitive channel